MNELMRRRFERHPTQAPMRYSISDEGEYHPCSWFYKTGENRHRGVLSKKMIKKGFGEILVLLMLKCLGGG